MSLAAVLEFDFILVIRKHFYIKLFTAKLILGAGTAEAQTLKHSGMTPEMEGGTWCLVLCGREMNEL